MSVNVSTSLVSNVSSIIDSQNVLTWQDVFYFVFENSLIGMAIVNTQGVFVKVNQKLCQIFEYNENEIVGKNWKNFTYLNDIPKSNNYIESLKNKSNKSDTSDTTIEKRYVSKSGKIKYCRLTLNPIVLPNEISKCVIAQIEDLTKKMKVINSINAFRDNCHIATSPHCHKNLKITILN
jgi:PAS domain S-box-containing protein